MNVCREYGVTCDLANENGYCKVTGCIRKEYRIFTKPIVDEDLIRRSDAIKAIEELPNAYNGWSDTYDKAYIIGTLEEVPRAKQTEPQTMYYPQVDGITPSVIQTEPKFDKDINVRSKDEPQTEDEILREQCRAFIDIVKQTDCSWK